MVYGHRLAASRQSATSVERQSGSALVADQMALVYLPRRCGCWTSTECWLDVWRKDF